MSFFFTPLCHPLEGHRPLKYHSGKLNDNHLKWNVGKFFLSEIPYSSYVSFSEPQLNSCWVLLFIYNYLLLMFLFPVFFYFFFCWLSFLTECHLYFAKKCKQFKLSPLIAKAIYIFLNHIHLIWNHARTFAYILNICSPFIHLSLRELLLYNIWNFCANY